MQVDLKTLALQKLRALVQNPEAQFHDGQYEAIEALVAERVVPWLYSAPVGESQRSTSSHHSFCVSRVMGPP